MATKKKTLVQYHGLGRRKSSTCRVILTPGSGKILVNGVDVNDYMPYPTLVMDLTCNVVGGGFAGQSGAIRLGIARALLEASSDYRPVLKKAGMLTRDSRAKERKKYGLKGARRAPQFSKR